jgi:hypothetical protein
MWHSALGILRFEAIVRSAIWQELVKLVQPLRSSPNSWSMLAVRDERNGAERALRRWQVAVPDGRGYSPTPSLAEERSWAEAWLTPPGIWYGGIV